VLVQANYGSRPDLRLEGLPVGATITYDQVAAPWPEVRSQGSIIIVIATDAPLLSDQCRRLAKRATIGLGRVGGTGHNGSGDIFVAFATGNHFPQGHKGPYSIKALPTDHMDELFQATIEATEEAIWNALCGAKTMTGYKDRTAHALPLDRLVDLWEARPRL
jgi:D-aminopeptidase